MEVQYEILYLIHLSSNNAHQFGMQFLIIWEVFKDILPIDII